ncbi:MAG: hypothetical protein WBD22_03400 [Pyrinomonadaceae bacterium]
MPPQLVTFRLNQLRCIRESDGTGGSEPYLWVTYFALDGRNIAMPEPVTTHTPAYDAFRTEMADNVADGQIMNVPVFIASASLEVDPGPLDFMMAGCIAVLLEEDETPQDAIIPGRMAYSDEIHEQLNLLVSKRIGDVNRDPITDAEVKTINDAVKSAVKDAISDNLSLGEKLFDNQDDVLGSTFVNFIDGEIVSRTFEFPEIFNGDDPQSSSNRFVLNGSITVGPVPRPPIILCPEQRAALQAKKDEIKGLHLRRTLLQQQLQTASPQAKPAIVREITATAERITRAEAELPALQAALDACLPNLPDVDIDIGGGGVLDPG